VPLAAPDEQRLFVEPERVSITSTSIRVSAPASVANLGAGFDVIGLAIEQPADIVEVEPSERPGVVIVAVVGTVGPVTTDPARNVAGVAATAVLRMVQSQRAWNAAREGSAGVRLRLHKHVPLAGGLGSSAASSVASAVAVNELLGRPLAPLDVLACAMQGEQAACGAAHADNAAPSLLGGIVLIRSYEPLEIVPLPCPSHLWIAVVHPHHPVPTEVARRLLEQRRPSLADAVANLGNFGAFVSALHRGDLALLGRSVHDRLAEPLRAELIPGFHDVRNAAIGAGALGCSIAGAGPSVFAFCEEEGTARRVASAMRAAFSRAARLQTDSYVGRVNTRGAERID
jgi:homoserine kinase